MHFLFKVIDNYSHDSHSMDGESKSCEALYSHCLAMSPIGSYLSCENALKTNHKPSPKTNNAKTRGVALLRSIPVRLPSPLQELSPRSSSPRT
jgi:hypothetical protein